MSLSHYTKSLCFPAQLQNQNFPPLEETSHPCFHLTVAAVKGLILVAPTLTRACFINLCIYCWPTPVWNQCLQQGCGTDLSPAISGTSSKSCWASLATTLLVYSLCSYGSNTASDTDTWKSALVAGPGKPWGCQLGVESGQYLKTKENAP